VIEVNFAEFQRRFPTQEEVFTYFKRVLYNGKVKCNHCHSERVYQRRTTPKLFDCNECGNTFSMFKDTVFEKTTTDLKKWMYAIYSYLSSEGELTISQLQREIVVSYKTAWRMLKKIRDLLDSGERESILKGGKKCQEEIEQDPLAQVR